MVYEQTILNAVLPEPSEKQGPDDDPALFQVRAAGLSQESDGADRRLERIVRLLDK